MTRPESGESPGDGVGNDQSRGQREAARGGGEVSHSAEDPARRPSAFEGGEGGGGAGSVVAP